MFTYSPRIDFAFKKLFGSEENSDILMALINSILDQEHQISELEVLNPYRPGVVPIDKTVILDVRARDEQGCQYHIEMQVSGEIEYDQRALYYWSKLYANQLKKGDHYRELKKTISVHILNFDYFHEEAGYHHTFHLRHAHSKRHYFEDLELHFIELERFRKTNPQLMSALDRWAAFLSRAEEYDRKTIPEILKTDPHIVRAFDALGHLSLNDKEREIYDARQKWFMDEALILEKTLQKGRAEGRAKGHAEGHAAGHAAGHAEGEAIGIKKGQQKTLRQLAQKLKAQGQTNTTIAEFLEVQPKTLANLLEE